MRPWVMDDLIRRIDTYHGRMTELELGFYFYLYISFFSRRVRLYVGRSVHSFTHSLTGTVYIAATGEWSV